MKGGGVQVSAVTKRYGPMVAVDDVSVSINPEEIYALVGANGAGKSTLIRAMAGITAADSGQISICGYDVRKHSVQAKRCLGYLPEELILYERLTASEFLELVAALKEADPVGIPEAIEFFELKEASTKYIGSYSQGMRKKLGLAAAMLGTPDVLVLDEPLNGLDVGMMRKLRKRVRAERDSGRAILISSHVMDFVERTADRVGIMSRGRIVAEGTPQELRRLSNLETGAFEDVFFHYANVETK